MNNQRFFTRAGAVIALALMAALAFTPAAAVLAAGSISVGTTADVVDGNTTSLSALAASPGADGSISLREALLAANSTASSAGSPNVINIPAGTYNLGSVGTIELRVGGPTNRATSIVGAGAGSTIVHQTVASQRVFNLDPNVDGGVTVNISGVTISGGTGTAFGGGGILGGGTGDSTTLDDVTLTGNTTSGSNLGGAINWGEGNLVIKNSSIANNSSDRSGGGIAFNLGGNAGSLAISNTTIANNTVNNAAGGVGGGLMITGLNTVTITNSNISNNTLSGGSAANQQGGAIDLQGGTLNLSFSRIAGNSAGNGSAIFAAGGATLNANDNWWGCNGGPGSACGGNTANGIAGTGTISAARWLQLRAAASPNTLALSETSALAADLFGRNSGGPIAASDLAGLPAFPAPPAPIFGNAQKGTLSNAATQFVGGQASATFTATACGTGGADAAADSQTLTAAITVQCFDTTTTITSDTPDPSTVGQAVAIHYSVVANAPGAGTPSGSVTVSDGADSCTGTVADGQCMLTFTSAGTKNLIATYAGAGVYNRSVSGNVSHNVNQLGASTTTITSDTPDPSNVGQDVTVRYNVTGSGLNIPAGNVTVSDGVDSCTGTVADGGCTLKLTTPGSRTLIATYAGNSALTGSTSAGEPHTVGQADTTPPNVTIEQAAGQADPTSSSPINFTVVFNEPVTGFTSADVHLGGTAGANTATVSEIAPNDGTTYSVAVSGMAGSGTVVADIPANGATDAAGNGNTASTSADNTVTFSVPPVLTPDLTIAKTHSGNFTQGQAGAQYTITVSNGGSGPSSGTVTVVDTLPAGLAATALSGNGWSCTLATLTCTRADALAGGGSYPLITLTANVAADARASITNHAAVSGGGEQNTANDTADDPTTVGAQQTTYLAIIKSHIGNFTQGQAGAQYSIVVKNNGTAASSGAVTVADQLPVGLAATAIGGSGWSCTLATLSCTRSDALAGGGSYPNILVMVNVASNAPASVTNTATVSGGGDQSANDNTAADPTTITATTSPASAQLVSDPCVPGQRALVVGGTAGADTIKLAAASGGKIGVQVNGANLGTFKPTGLIIVLGQAGDDTISVAKAILLPRILYGNDGNDTIKDGFGLGAIVGGAGDDTLDSASSRDILIGGAGADKLTGSPADDILIAGDTSYDEPTAASQKALCAIYAEWSHIGLSYQARINHLTGATSGGLNGSYLLKPGQTVLDDGSPDTLKGGLGQDWFLLHQGGGALDTSDRSGSEVATNT